MKDFIRIGGPIVSYPLNENFRRMRNAISMANVNLFFPEEDGEVSTVAQMYEIPDPLDGQVCYVISNGCFYRYSKADNEWHEIMNVGQTFRQGFLNSGAVILEGPMALKDGTTTVIEMPAMLVYFKNKEGDGDYLKGMYKINAQEIDISTPEYGVSGGNAWSIFVDCDGHYSVTTGMPATDDVNHIFIGTFLTDSVSHVIPECIYTLPDMAYTADRGNFLLNGGQAVGLNLTAATDGGIKVARQDGYYYDEGINYPTGDTEDFPVDNDNGSNYDLKHYDGEDPVGKIIYIAPNNGLNYNIEYTEGLVYNKYWNGAGLSDVPAGYFTIQQHLVTPNGQNFIVYGSQLYNSITDAVSNVNTTFGLDIDFPYVEATRIVLGVIEGETFDTGNNDECRFFTMGRLAQVGTISPEFADTLFRIYSGDAGDTTPSTMKFDLNALQTEQFNNLYSIGILPSAVIRNKFAIPNKYIKGTGQSTVLEPTVTTLNETRSYTGELYGYQIADQKDIDDIIARLNSIEIELWNPYVNSAERERQSVRYRLFNIESRLDAIDITLADHENRITYLEQYKVHKNTTINGYKLGDNTQNNEAKTITLWTGDISEGAGRGTSANLWYTEARVNANAHVVTAYNHANTTSANDSASTHTVINPHNLSTDDIKLLNGTQRVFVTPEEERRIRSDRLPDNTIAELAKKLESVNIQSINGNSTSPGTTENLGDVVALKFYKDGANVTVDSNSKTAIIECVGQFDENTYMKKVDYAYNSLTHPEMYGGYVDKAISADNITVATEAGPNQYYGTADDTQDVGMHDLPVYVSTTEAGDYTDADTTTFQPIPQSIMLKHLANSRVLYPANSEESKLQTNVYDLVKNHYHKVYNSGTQGPYIDGSTSQDISAIKYGYTVPVGGLSPHIYYFAYNNQNYSFTTSSNIAAGAEFSFVPSTETLSYQIGSTTPVTLNIEEVFGEDVDADYFLNFVSKTDWDKINEWNFGDNLTVTVTNGRATINAAVAGQGASNFVNLGDVDVVYNDSNLSKMVVLGKVGNNYKLQFSEAPALYRYMLISDYVDDSIEKVVKKAALATTATTAESANTVQGTYTVNDLANDNTKLWSAAKIISNTSTQIQNESVRTYSGTAAPSNSLGKDGDIFVLIEE